MTLVAPTTEVFIEYIGADSSQVSAAYSALATATVLVDDFLLLAFRVIPQAIYTQVVLDTAHAVWKRKDSPNSMSQYADGGGMPMRQPNNPLSQSMPLLRRYVAPF